MLGRFVALFAIVFGFFGCGAALLPTMAGNRELLVFLAIALFTCAAAIGIWQLVDLAEEFAAERERAAQANKSVTAEPAVTRSKYAK